MEIKYKTTEKFNQDVINEILRIEKEYGLTPENVVKNAKNKKSPLHELFEWDDSLAAEKWRLAEL